MPPQAVKSEAAKSRIIETCDFFIVASLYDLSVYLTVYCQNQKAAPNTNTTPPTTHASRLTLAEKRGSRIRV
jgi:hypothetical protein